MKRVYRFIKNKKLQSRLKTKDITILCFPIIDNIDIYNRELSRILWYTNPFSNKIKKITFILHPKLIESTQMFKVPSFADSKIINYFRILQNKIEFITNTNQLRTQKIDIVFRWSRIENFPKKQFSFPYFIDASVNENQFEANQAVKMSEVFLDNKVKLDNQNRIINLLKNFQKNNYKSVTLFGSAPSLKDYKSFNYADSILIICNSIVKNKKLLMELKPNIIVATDAVFHSGYSAYAAEFRKNLCDAFDLLDDLSFVVPLRDLLIYQKNLPEKYNNRIYGLESKNLKTFNLNVVNKSFVKSTSNVLTLFMLPIAATLSKNINIIGFDGKEKTIKDTFWHYDTQSQFSDSIKSTKLAHPAFYQVNYDEYYGLHCKETKLIMNDLLKKGYKIKPLTLSYIPALRKLYD